MSNNITSGHPLDEAVALRPLSDDGQGARRYTGQTHPGYNNMLGPYGGITAAQAIAAVMNHPQRLGEPIAFTGNYIVALAKGPFEIEAEPARTSRTTQHWLIRITQTGANGAAAVVFTATAITALRRPTWSGDDAPMPTGLPAPDDIARPAWSGGDAPVPWLARYDARFIAGPLPDRWNGQENDSRTLLWMRDEPPRPLDFISLTALSDFFFPRIWRRRAILTPIGTVSITIYYHASAADLAAAGADYLLGEARGQSFFNGFFDQNARLWRRDGRLLATTHQMVYYKE
jgi:acyl-CoA thioesterase